MKLEWWGGGSDLLIPFENSQIKSTYIKSSGADRNFRIPPLAESNLTFISKDFGLYYSLQE